MSFRSILDEAKTQKHLSVDHAIICTTSFFGRVGEYGTRPRENPIQRLIDHITMMMDIVNLEHQNRHFFKASDGSFKVKPGHEDCLTKVSLVEFSLHTANEPLKFEDLEKILAAISEKAKSCHANLSFLFSSFAVLTSEKMVLNYPVHVQCGEFFKLQPMYKRSLRGDDPNYHINFFRLMQYLKNKESTKSRFFSQSSAYPIEPKLPIVEVPTLGGNVMLDLVDVCADVELDPVSPHLQDMLPFHVSHTITSNTNRVMWDRVVGDYIAHADYANPGVKSKEHNLPTRPTTLSSEQLRNTVPSHYPETKIAVNEKEIKVTDPPFGGEYAIIFYPEVKLANSNAIVTHEFGKQLELFYKKFHTSEQCLRLKSLGIEEAAWTSICSRLAKFKGMLAHPVTEQKYYTLKDTLLVGQDALESLANLIVQLADRYKQKQISADSEVSFIKEFNYLTDMYVSLNEMYCTWVSYLPNKFNKTVVEGTYEGESLKKVRVQGESLIKLAEKIKNERLFTATPNLNMGILAAMLYRVTQTDVVPKQLIIDIQHQIQLLKKEREHFSSSKDISMELAFYASCDRLEDCIKNLDKPSMSAVPRST